MEVVEERKVGDKSLTEGIDTTSALRRLTFHIFGGWQSLSGRSTTKRSPRMQALMRNLDSSTRQICERLEISKATLYRYIASEGSGGDDLPAELSF